jgi:hypothetical protein
MLIPMFLRGPLILLAIIISLIVLEFASGGIGQYLYLVFPCETPPGNSANCYVGYDGMFLLGLFLLGFGAVIIMIGRFIELLISRHKKFTTKP